MGILKTYYTLAKPGIIYGNALTMVGGFLLAAKGNVHAGLFLAALVGLSLVMGSSCVFNNYIDRGIDKKMARTRARALVQGSVPLRSALIYATALGVLGFAILALYTNWLAVTVAALGMVDYVILYGLAKRRSVHGTLVGSIAGATPVVVGYVAAANRFDAAAFILFLILALWQMPHFYAIAIYRRSDYAAAHLPVLPVKKGVRATKIAIVAYIVAFMAAIASLALCGYAGLSYSAVMLALSAMWLWRAAQGFSTNDDARWARKLFLFSLIVIAALSVMLALNNILP